MEKVSDGLCKDCRVLSSVYGIHYTFYSAVYNYHIECARIFLFNGADPKVQRNPYINPLQMAIRDKHLKMVQFLVIEARVDINKSHALNQCCIHTNVLNPIAQLLIECNASCVDPPQSYIKYRNKLANCRLAQQALKRVFEKTKVVCKDLIPMILNMIWQTRKHKKWAKK